MCKKRPPSRAQLRVGTGEASSIASQQVVQILRCSEGRTSTPVTDAGLLHAEARAPSASVRHRGGGPGVCPRPTLALRQVPAEASGRARSLFLRCAHSAARGFGPRLHGMRPRCGFWKHRRFSGPVKARFVVILSLDAGHTTLKVERMRTNLCSRVPRSLLKR